jgi:hypothetical protein
MRGKGPTISVLRPETRVSQAGGLSGAAHLPQATNLTDRILQPREIRSGQLATRIGQQLIRYCYAHLGVSQRPLRVQNILAVCISGAELKRTVRI